MRSYTYTLSISDFDLFLYESSNTTTEIFHRRYCPSIPSHLHYDYALPGALDLFYTILTASHQKNGSAASIRNLLKGLTYLGNT